MESVAANTEESQNPNPNPNSPKPIAELVSRPDFPQCALNEFVDIGGYAGTVVDIVHNSLKVRSPEQTTKSFNFHTLKKLYGPRVEVEAQTATQQPTAPPPTSIAESPKLEPKRNVISSLNFDAPVKQLSEFIKRPDFPQCTFGEHLEINGYTGVVVEIVNRSLKVRSQEEVTRSYNADVLRKLYGGGK